MNEQPGQSALFDPDRLTTDGLPRDCPSCKGAGERVSQRTGELVTCGNCRGTGRAVIPYDTEVQQ